MIFSEKNVDCRVDCRIAKFQLHFQSHFVEMVMEINLVFTFNWLFTIENFISRQFIGIITR